MFLRIFDELVYVRISLVRASFRIDSALHFSDEITVTVHKTIASNAPDDELSSPRNMSASMH